MKVDPEWWKRLFDDVYLLTDARSVCDEHITRREVDLICGLVPVQSGDAILDLCGGHGRHSLELWRRGFRECTVLDYSNHLLETGRDAARKQGSRIKFLQGDARQTGLSPSTFDHVLVMGNSLGYGTDQDDDRRILKEARRLLKQGGWILVDVADGSTIRKGFNPNAWHEIGDDITVCRQRELQGDVLCAREVVLCKRRGLIRDQTYSIRFYQPEGLASLLAGAGFKKVKVNVDFSPHRKKGDYGFMNHRMVATGVRL